MHSTITNYFLKETTVVKLAFRVHAALGFLFLLVYIAFFFSVGHIQGTLK